MISSYRCLKQTFEWLGRFVLANKFEHAVKFVVFSFSGLLSAHVLAELIRKNERHGNKYMKWYQGELLEMAKDLGYRLLPAFNTTSGLPHARINLKYGMKSDELKNSRETCTGMN